MIPINIVIGDRSYRVKAHPKDEEVVRKTMKTINDKILEFKTQFAGKDMQDYIAMVLLWFATQFSANHASDTVSEDVARQLASLEKQLDEVLSGS